MRGKLLRIKIHLSEYLRKTEKITMEAKIYKIIIQNLFQTISSTAA